MSSLFTLLPAVTWPLSQIIATVIAFLGALLIIYAVFLEAERRQDLVFIVGGSCLFGYALWINNAIFMLAMGGLVLASLFELIQILTGRHHHVCFPSDVVKNPKGKLYTPEKK